MRSGCARTTPSRCSASTDSGGAGQKFVSPAMPTFGWKKATNDPSAARLTVMPGHFFISSIK